MVIREAIVGAEVVPLSLGRYGLVAKKRHSEGLTDAARGRVHVATRYIRYLIIQTTYCTYSRHINTARPQPLYSTVLYCTQCIRTKMRAPDLSAGRRALLAATLIAGSRPILPAAAAPKAVSSGVPELSNSIVASRDTNISPKEIYIQLRNEEALRPERNGVIETGGRALDLGAGAGVSTQALYDIGWKTVVAVDPSRLAWDAYAAGESLPPGIQFEHASDEQYLEKWAATGKTPYQLVVLNYAVNHDKAARLAKLLLAPGGHLLAPTNVQNDYWFNQQYEFFDDQANVRWTKGTLGSYSVLFQPDFTSASCQGQWCPNIRNDDASKQLKL